MTDTTICATCARPITAHHEVFEHVSCTVPPPASPALQGQAIAGNDEAVIQAEAKKLWWRHWKRGDRINKRRYR